MKKGKTTPIYTEAIMVNLLKEDRKRYCTMDEIQRLCVYIYRRLVEEDKIGKNKYSINFAISFEAIERNVLYNNMIFQLGADGDIVYLREGNDVEELVQKFQADIVIRGYIRDFIKQTA